MAITTADELLHAQDIGRCELVRGELRMLDYRGFESGRVAARLGSELNRFAESRGCGTVLAHVGFVLARGPDTVRAPDIAFLRADRVVVGNRGYVEGAPDLAVEVPSEDPPGYVQDKVGEWLEAGAGAVWVVDPRERRVTVHRAGAEPAVLREADTLRGDGALRGFEVAMREVFAA